MRALLNLESSSQPMRMMDMFFFRNVWHYIYGDEMNMAVEAILISNIIIYLIVDDIDIFILTCVIFFILHYHRS